MAVLDCLPNPLLSAKLPSREMEGGGVVLEQVDNKFHVGTKQARIKCADGVLRPK